MPSPFRCAIYARYSSEKQRESSLEDQERLCRQEAERLGYVVTKIYKDAALSGQLNEDQRPGFQAMQEAARRREFDVLIVDDASRLSRDQSDALRTLKRFEFWGVGLIARTDGVNTIQNPKSSRLLFGVKSAFSEEFLRDLAEKTHRGLEGRARNGFSPGGLPYGYRSEPAYDDQRRIIGYRRTVYEPEAEVIRRIFRLYVGDESPGPLSPRQIAHLLNREGLLPPGARWKNRDKRQCSSWSFTAIIGHRRLAKGILNNALYVGRSLWNRSEWRRDPDSKAYTYRVRPTEEWIAVESPELRIVPQDLWDRVQTRQALNTTAPSGKTPVRGKYLLSGLVRCGVCGGTYTIRTPYSYACTTNHTRGASVCANQLHAPRVRLERAVLRGLRDLCSDPAEFAALTDQVREILHMRAREAGTKAMHHNAEATLRKLDREIANLKALLASGKATPRAMAELEAMLTARDAERADIERGQRPGADVIEARLAQVLATLPERVRGHLNDLDTLLAVNQVNRGKEILATLDAQIVLRPAGDHLNAEISGNLGRVFALVAAKDRRGSNSWLGEEDSNPR